MRELGIQKRNFSLLLFEHRYLSWYIRYTYENLRTYRKHYDVVNCVSDFLNMAQVFVL